MTKFVSRKQTLSISVSPRALSRFDRHYCLCLRVSLISRLKCDYVVVFIPFNRFPPVPSLSDSRIYQAPLLQFVIKAIALLTTTFSLLTTIANGFASISHQCVEVALNIVYQCNRLIEPFLLMSVFRRCSV